MKQKAQVLVLILVITIAVFALIGVGLVVTSAIQRNKQADTGGGTPGERSFINVPNEKDLKKSSATTPPLLLKTIGVNLDYFDAKTGMAGDLKFTKAKFTSGIQLLFSDFGYVIKGENSASGQDKANPQPTFIVPIGTKVHSLVDGVVVSVPKLYSNDYSVQVADDKNSQWLYETEHVVNPLVKAGDTVKAGQVIAEVSDYSAHGYDGLGLVEIGILHGGNPPEHVCPFAYLDPSIKDETFARLKALYKSWEEYRGDTSLYDEEKMQSTGCITLEPIEG